MGARREYGCVASSFSARAAAVPDLLNLLRDEHRIVEIGTGLYIEVETEAELRRKVTDRLADGSAITMSELRDLLGTTRRYAVPIGESFDRIGQTKREGDTRRLGPAVQRTPPQLSDRRAEFGILQVRPISISWPSNVMNKMK
jgi:Elongation factor SelB, winged helix